MDGLSCPMVGESFYGEGRVDEKCRNKRGKEAWVLLLGLEGWEVFWFVGFRVRVLGEESSGYESGQHGSEGIGVDF